MDVASTTLNSYDLVIDSNSTVLPFMLLTDIKIAFQESDLPYKVDIIDWDRIYVSYRFRAS